LKKVEVEPELEVEESELDEMELRKKSNPRWLYAIDRRMGRYWLMCLAGVMTNRFSKKRLLEPWYQKFCTDGWGAYPPAQMHEVGKRKTQRLSANIFDSELESSDCL